MPARVIFVFVGAVVGVILCAVGAHEDAARARRLDARYDGAMCTTGLCLADDGGVLCELTYACVADCRYANKTDTRWMAAGGNVAKWSNGQHLCWRDARHLYSNNEFNVGGAGAPHTPRQVQRASS